MRGRLGGILVAVAICVIGATFVVPASAAGLRVRKSVTKLEASERQAFIDAIYALKAAESPWTPGLSWYDEFVTWHVYLTECQSTDFLMTNTMTGHAGPMFLPWHRQYLLMFEDALRVASGNSEVTIPYWDWTDPKSASTVFTPDFMGGNGDPAQDHAVTDGAFRKGRWTVDVAPSYYFAPEIPPYLQRKMGDFATLPKPSEVDEVLGISLYDVSPWDDASDHTKSFRNALEGFRTDPRTDVHGWTGCPPNGTEAPKGFVGSLPFGRGALHNIVHLIVGGVIDNSNPLASRVGTMDNVAISPADPVFWLHHAMIDRVWARWQEQTGTSDYLSERNANRIDDPMHPFEKGLGSEVTPRDVDLPVRNLGYVYDTAAVTPSQQAAMTRHARSADGRRFRRQRARFRALCRLR